MLLNDLFLENMSKIFLLVCCFRVLVCSEESITLGEFDEGTDFEGEDPDKEEEEPFDHSAFLQIDETSDLHIPKQTKRVRQRIRMIVKEIDVDKDSKISEKELSDWIEKVMTKYLTSEGQRQMPKIDKDDDGLASWIEYSSAAGYTQGDIPEPKKSSEKSKQRDKEKFDLADIDKDGKLTSYELGVMIHPNEAPQMSNIIVTEFLEVMDKDHDGQLSFKEFVGEDPSLPAIDKTTEQDMKKVFKELDLDQDGKLNNKELAEWLLPNNKPPHQNEAENLIRDVDDNKDGALSVEEIIKNYLKFATSRATRYGRMLKDEEPSLEDDEIIVKKIEGVGKQKEKMKEEKQENETEKQNGKSKEKQEKEAEKENKKMKEQKQEDEGDKNKKEKRKPADEL